MKKGVFLLVHFSLLLFSGAVSAQNIGINTDGSAPESGVMLDVKGTSPIATTAAASNLFQIKSFNADAAALKLRLGLKTDATAGSRYGLIDVYDAGAAAYRSLSLQPLGGNVGVGTVSPEQTLHVTASGTSAQLVLERTGASAGKMAIGTDNLGFSIFETAGYNRRVTVQSGGNVGIGTTVPSTKLHVFKGNAGAQPAWTAVDIAIFENVAATNGAVQIFSDNASQGGYAFSNNTVRNAGGMFYQHSTNTMLFTTNGNGIGHLFIDNAGNVGINQGSPTAKLEVVGSSGSTIKIVDTNEGLNKVLTSDASGQGSWQTLSSISGSGCFTNWQLFTADGNFTVPAGITKIKVQVWGGGGAGGGVGIAGLSGGGGGGGGGYAEGTYTVVPAAVHAVTIGAGGVGAANANGGNGGTTSFGSPVMISATGGTGGLKVGGDLAGGTGGIGSGGYMNITLGNGGHGLLISGGSTYGSASNGAGDGGTGASGSTGGGGGGGGPGGGNGSGNGAGGAAVANSGAGGGGGGGAASVAGGNGAAGKVIVFW